MNYIESDIILSSNNITYKAVKFIDNKQQTFIVANDINDSIKSVTYRLYNDKLLFICGSVDNFDLDRINSITENLKERIIAGISEWAKQR